MEFFVALLIVLAVGIFIVELIQAAAKEAENDCQPVLSVNARVVAKRHITTGGGIPSTWHYVTFELESGARKEFSIRGDEYGMLAEHDKGILIYSDPK